MKYFAPLAMVSFILGAMLSSTDAMAAAPETKGKTCRMEQQCHWENFKKVCVYVKVCR